ncbi:DegT/DnrJ/EryC1/StrS family aminotransferase [Dictyobacter kobayashii]|uniref:Aminotransferase DegT n=1 Tax=Dictyobacter kobayashii TaxID=2014872 RepID=A0A402APL0_9CHLR|nr:DegT/DnrJ/EryC1/StrS family aminotransferase [Dictyobacter kobayashii]GCE20969.1 aminotransferase DegT [Dictyobacter kobayashii]
MIDIAHPIMGVEEEEAVRRVLASGKLAQGTNVAAFEQCFAELCHVREAIAVSSGTSALLLALLAHDIGPGDEVITSAFSFTATANAILLVGAIPVFVDIDPETYTIDPIQVRAAITRRTKVIMPVHLYGHLSDMQQLQIIAQEHSLTIIEDAAQAHGATMHGCLAGSFGTGCFSFYATKNITTGGEGGMITTNDTTIAEKARLLRNHGQVSRYNQVDLGYNMRMTEIQGAIGIAQVKKLEDLTQRRIANAHYLSEQLQDAVQTPVTRPGYRHVYHQYTIRITRMDRNQCAIKLRDCGIETTVHYPLPIYRQPFYRRTTSLYRIFTSEKRKRQKDGDLPGHLPVTEQATQQVLSLPVHPALSPEDLAKIAREVLALCK